ncbi:Retrotransposon gag domain [Arabidopsis suecica]|uniref:Retrotransposon gag domain n=1 Tax=Arabidopsis suecica TaxID=45249 RepID=A0A8T2B2W0_ARASU|nr:Retrotransposon gag domain [Arabidopsis suecica]
MSLKEMRWKNNFKVDIPKFHGGISSDSFLDWLVDVEEILEFQSVSEDQLVSLVVKKFRGHAASWWHQVKTKRKQAGKSPIKSWTKLKQKLCATFLPPHYGSLVYSRRLQNLKQRTRFVDDYVEDCHVQVNDFVEKPAYGIDDNELITTKPHGYDASIFDVEDDIDRDAYDDLIQNEDNKLFVQEVKGPKVEDLNFDIKDNEDGDVVDVADNDDVEAKEDDVMDLENDDIIVYIETGDDFVNTDVNDEDSTLANRINVSNVFAAIFEDCDSQDDPRQDEGSSFDVTKVGDLVDNVNPIVVFSDGFSPVHDGCLEDVNNIDVIRNQVVEYSRLSTIKYELVITILDKEEEDSYMDKETHKYSIYLAHRHQKINGEPPDRGRSVILFFHGELDLYNKISGTLVSKIYKGENHCYDDLYGEILEGEVIEFAKPLVSFRHCGSTREDFHVSYISNQQDERIYVFSSRMKFMNWVFGNKIPMKNPWHQLGVFGENVDTIKHVDFFFPIGELDIKKMQPVDFCVECSIIMMLLSREVLGAFYLATNSMCLHLRMCALVTKTCEGRKVFQLFLMPFDLDVRDRAYIGRSYLKGFVVDYTQILWEVSNVYTAKWLQEILMVERRIQVAAFQIQVSFLVGLDKVQIDSLLQDLFIGLRTCLRWNSIMFCLIEKDTGVVFKDHSCSKKSCFLVVVGSLEVVLAVGDVSKIHLQDIIDEELTLCEASTWVNKAVRQLRLDSNYIFTTFICWSDFACESRKLLTCGKLSLVVPCFSTNVRFLVGKETTNALVVALMWKLHALRLGINSSPLTLPKITHGVLKKKTNAVDVRWKLFDSSLDMHSAFHPHTRYKASNVKRRDVVFDPCDFVCILFANDRLPPHEYQKASFSPKIEISVFIFPQRVFEIRHGDTLNLSFRDKRTRLHMLPTTIGWIYKIYEIRSLYNENEGLLVTCVQGSLDGLIFLTKALYEGSLNKLHLRRKKKGHEVLMRNASSRSNVARFEDESSLTRGD